MPSNGVQWYYYGMEIIQLLTTMSLFIWLYIHVIYKVIYNFLWLIYYTHHLVPELNMLEKQCGKESTKSYIYFPL